MQKLKLILALSVVLFIFTGCSQGKEDPLVIWTDSPELASFVEDFNATHASTKAIVIYKKDTASSLPPAQDEIQPDVVIASWLLNSSIRKHFTPVDFLFDEHRINRTSFYPQLLEYGQINEKQYLLPLSFNLPMIIYSTANESLIETDHLIDLNTMKRIAGTFTNKSANSAYTTMGYAPGWDRDFIYEAAKINDVAFAERGKSFIWNKTRLSDTIIQMKQWTATFNTDSTTEKNFQFKYLYMPKYRQVTSGKCLFAYTSSSDFFSLTDSQSEGIGFRWLASNEQINIEDDILCIGLYKKAEHTKKAEIFISWLLDAKTQKHLLERNTHMKLDTRTFGLINGFSSIKSINDNVYPAYYRQLLGSLPGEKNLKVPDILPYRWPDIKEKIILPYLEDIVVTDSEKLPMNLDERIDNWTKQFF